MIKKLKSGVDELKFFGIDLCAFYCNWVLVKYQVLKTIEFEEWLADSNPNCVLRYSSLIELRWLNGTRVYSFMWGSAM